MKDRKKSLSIYGPEGTEKLFDAFSDVNDYKLRKQPFQLRIVEVGGS